MSANAAPKAVKIEQSADDKEHQKIEETFWRRQLWVAWILNILTAAASAAALISLCFIRQSLVDARLATEEANRAWIAPRGVSIDVEHSDPKKSIGLLVEFENIGKEPARNLTFVPYIDDYVGALPAETNKSNAKIKENNTCRSPIEGRPASFPIRQGGNEGMFLDMNSKDFLKNFPDVLRGKRVLYVEGCFSYVTFHRPHQTAFCYYLRPFRRTDSGKSQATVPDEWVHDVGKLDAPFVACPNTSTKTSFAN